MQQEQEISFCPWEKALYNLEGRGEREVQEQGNICIFMADSLCCKQHRKAIILQLKINFLKGKKKKEALLH